MTKTRIDVDLISAGDADAELLPLSEPVSFWGGVDFATGEITDRAHPNCGTSMANKIVLVPSTKGSTAGPGALLEFLNSDFAPAAIMTCGPDLVVGLSARMNAKRGKRQIPIGFLNETDFQTLSASVTSVSARIKNGRLTLA